MDHFSKSNEPDLLSHTDSKSLEDLSQELQVQQEKLLDLKRQQEEIERRKRELEELNKKRQELNIGQKSMKERLTRAIAILENAEYDARKGIEQIQITRQTFADHLGTIELIDPNKWPAETMDDLLTKSLSQIDHAKAIYAQARVRIDALSGKDIDENANSEDDEGSDENAETYGVSFGELVKRGFALSLPLIITLLIFAFVIAKKSA
jgi:DNA repair exonuclease SbcCD ATPase subunit